MYGSGRIHKAAAIKVGEYSPDGGMIRRAQVGKMKFGTSVLVGFDRILPSRACFASTVGAACAVGSDVLAGAAICPSGARIFVGSRGICSSTARCAYSVGGIGSIRGNVLSCCAR